MHALSTSRQIVNYKQSCSAVTQSTVATVKVSAHLLFATHKELKWCRQAARLQEQCAEHLFGQHLLQWPCSDQDTSEHNIMRSQAALAT